MDEVELEEVFLWIILFPPDSCHSTIAPYPSITAPRGAKLGASSVTLYLAGLGVKVVY
jgi:hypothetical protein